MKPKVLLLQTEISGYNVSTYNEIAKEFDFTIGYFSKDKSAKECLFEKKKFASKKIGPFTFVKGLHKFCKNFDVVCFVPDFHVPSFCVIPFMSHKYRVLSWSIGFRCSYTHPYVPERKHNILDWVYYKILSKCDANIFYMEKSKEFWKKTRLSKDNIFIAPNTTEIAKFDFIPEKKNDFLFVGTLYRGKGLDLLLSAFKQFKQRKQSGAKLIIVGKGEMESELKDFVQKEGLNESVIFTGAIYDEPTLATYFERSLLCFSPTQAGLSAPKSLGYGVPFVTRKDAITGGEIYHVTNGKTGILYESNDELLGIMLDAVDNREKYLKMGQNAMSYYQTNATIHHMAKGVIDAINHVLSKGRI